MKRKTILQSLIACVALGAIILAGGCQSMGTKDAATCPKCDQKVATFHPKKGMTYKKLNCTSCGKAVTLNEQSDVTGVTHYCEACGALVGECPVCKAKAKSM